MNKDVHDMDDLFRSALEGHEETPSASVKESLEASLDKKDAESYKKRFIIWKRTAFVLLLLLAGFILFDSGILQTGKGHSTKKSIAEKTNTPENPTKNNHVKSQKENLPDEVNKNEFNNTSTESFNKEKTNDQQQGITLNNKSGNQPDQKDEVNFNITNPGTAKNPAGNNAQKQKMNTGDMPQNNFKQNKKGETDLITSNPYSDINIPETKDIEIHKWIPDPAFLISNADIQKTLPALKQKTFPTINDSLLKNTIASNTKQENKNHFKPKWLMTGFVSYDRVNYKIDSDLPENITSIKHREVHEPSISGGILITRQLTKRWGLQSGLVFSNTQIGISPQKMYAYQQPGGSAAYKYITSSGYTYIKPGFGPQPNAGDSLLSSEAKHEMHYFSVPLAIKYTTAGKKFSFSPGIGIEANFITSEKLEVEIEDAFNREIVFINKLNGARSFYWSITANTELRYNINKKFSVSLRPSFRYALSSITKNNDVDTFPYNFGIGIGITHKFK